MELKQEFNEDGTCKHVHNNSPRPGPPRGPHIGPLPGPRPIPAFEVGGFEVFVTCVWCGAELKPGEKLNPLT